MEQNKGMDDLPPMIAIRARPRKAVNLIGNVNVGSQKGKVQMLCTVQDISTKGVRVSTDQVKVLSPNTDVHVSIFLDDRTKTRLEFPSRVRHIRREKTGAVVGIEFLEVDPSQAPALLKIVRDGVCQIG